MDADCEDWTDRANPYLVIRMQDGNYVFARCRIRTKGDTLIVVNGTWNSAGDRHLARYY